LYADGRIYVVVAVVATIFTGIIVFLINLDRKIAKIEKQLGSNK
jgi:CcmD family protein